MRSLNPLIKTRIEKYTFAPFPETTNQLLVPVAMSMLGIQASDIDLINAIRSTVTKPWNEAWCADFLQTCIAFVEQAKGVVSPLPATEGVLDLWHRSEAYRIDSPQSGDLILWQLGTTLQGHCGLITGQDTLTFSTIEGNTSNSNGIVRDGDGVFAKKRAKGGTKTFTQLGFLRCF